MDKSVKGVWNPTRAPCRLQRSEKDLTCMGRDVAHLHGHKYDAATERIIRKEAVRGKDTLVT